MAIYQSNIIQTSTITSAALVWDPSNSSTTTFGPRGAVPVLTPPQTLHDVTLINQGPGVVYIGSGSGVTTSTGLAVPVGAQVTIHGYTATAGSTTGRIYGVSATSAVVEVGLQTVDATV